MKQHDDSSAPEAASVQTQSAGVAGAARAPVTDRVNAEPAIINGMTVSEGRWIAVLCLTVYAVLGGLIWLLTGWWQTMPVITLFGAGATIWYVSLYLAKVKRKRPEGYYRLALHLWLAKHGLAQSQCMTHRGYWSLGRTIPGLVSPLAVHERAPGRVSSGTPQRQRRKQP
jgi:conjugative transfer region protein (TIGR03750 family)